MKKHFVYYCLAAFLFQVGCTIISQKPDEVAAVNIADAYFLGIHTDNPNNNLIQLTTSDFKALPDPVLFFDARGDVLGDKFSQIEADDIITLTETYVLFFGAFTFTLTDGEHCSNALIVNTETGSVHDLEDRYFPDWTNWYLGSMYHQTDAEGNIYYKYNGVSRLVIGDNESINYENYMDYYEGFQNEECFFVDKQGNVFFDAGRQVKLASGGIIETGEQLFLINGFGNKSIGFTEMDYPNQKAYYISIDGGELQKELLTDELHYTESFIGSKLYSDAENLVHFIITPSQIEHSEAIDRTFGLAVFESDNTVYTILPENNIEISIILGIEDNYLWIQSGEELYAIDLHSYNVHSEDLSLTFSEYIPFEIPEGYELQQVRFDRKGVVEIIAYNFNEEKRGKGFISMANGFEFIDDDSALGSIELTRIR